MTNQNNAAQTVQESERIAAADEYFKARAWLMDTTDNRRIFEAGFDRAYALPSKLRAPVADDLVHRLRGKYAMGPMIDGEPEFGWRDCSGPAPIGMHLPSPIMLEAAAAIERLAAQLRECAETLGAGQIDEQRAMRAYADAMALLAHLPHL